MMHPFTYSRAADADAAVSDLAGSAAADCSAAAPT